MSHLDDPIEYEAFKTSRELSPTYKLGKDTKRNRVDEINELSKKSLEAIQKKYGNPQATKKVFIVTEDLELVDI